MKDCFSDDLLRLDPQLSYQEQAAQRFARIQAGLGTAPVLGEHAYAGLVGEIVRAPDTEATDAAMLVSVLVQFCGQVGRGAWVNVGDTRHYPVIFAVIVGGTSKDRKGTSLSAVRPIIAAGDDNADPFFPERLQKGIGSGEALVQLISTIGGDGGALPSSGSGSEDQRLVLIEEEYASVMTVAGRQGSILSATIRTLWDSDSLANITKGSRLRADHPHVCILGHITQEELAKNFKAVDGSNGYANRFLHIESRRSKLLPSPKPLDEALTEQLGDKLRSAIKFAQSAGEIRRSSAFEELWTRVYNVLETQRDGGGQFGNLTARSSAYLTRLSMIYALLDRSSTLEPRHLRSALAVWEYAEASAARLWAPSLGSPNLDRLAEALKSAPNGLTRAGIYKVFSNNLPADELETMVWQLVDLGLAREDMRPSPGGGRPATVLISTST